MRDRYPRHAVELSVQHPPAADHEPRGAGHRAGGGARLLAARMPFGSTRKTASTCGGGLGIHASPARRRGLSSPGGRCGPARALKKRSSCPRRRVPRAGTTV
jgi:hypothetical protein